jgi:3-dehydroquinate synthase
VNASPLPWNTVLASANPDVVGWIREPMLDTTLVAEYADRLTEVCEKNALCQCTVKGGEDLKSLDRLPDLFAQFSEWGLTRHSVVVTTGGGALSDAVGFAASIWKRGMKVIHIPTTTLSMVDAAWGGKTGLNWNGIKNQIGSLELPLAVHLDARWLATLPDREFRAGLAEAAKHAMLDPSGLQQLQTALPEGPLTSPSASKAWTHWLENSAGTKMRIVNDDLHEQGSRSVLNLGHTVGHALEALCTDAPNGLLHGEAVALGLLFSMHEARHPVWSDAGDSVERQGHAELADAWLRRHVPIPAVGLPDAERMWECMLHDKKNTSGVVRDVAWRGMGSVIWPVEWKKTAFEATWASFLRCWSESRVPRETET